MIILGKKTVGRLETLQYANKKFNWPDGVIGISAWYGFWAWLLARLTGRKCIYYCIDFYSPEVFTGWWDKIFIPLAIMVDKFLWYHCDDVWDISYKITEGRTTFSDYGWSKRSIIVPLSYPPSYFNFINPIFEEPVFVGLVPYGKEIMPENTYYIDGKMPLQRMLNLIARHPIGISMWEKDGNNYYGDPGKTKLYSACGLPVIMTDNTPYAQIIKETGAGLVIPYNGLLLQNAIRIILDNYAYYKDNVKKTWPYINADEVFRDIRLLES